MTVTLPRPTRRTLVRSAAWSVPVVSLAAMAPAFAASTSAKVTGGVAVKWGGQGPKHVEWDLKLVTIAAVSNISIAFTYYPNGGGGTATFTALKIYSFSSVVDNNWSVPPIPAGGSNSATVSYGPTTGGSIIGANTTTDIHTDFTGTDNSTGTVTALVTVTYTSGTTETLPIITADWGQGSPHTHVGTTP